MNKNYSIPFSCLVIDIDYSHGIVYCQHDVLGEIEAVWSGRLDAAPGEMVNVVIDNSLDTYRCISTESF